MKTFLDSYLPGIGSAVLIPYFMTEEGGLTTKNKLYVTELPEAVSDISIKIYNSKNLDSIYIDAPQNGFSIIIMPG